VTHTEQDSDVQVSVERKPNCRIEMNVKAGSSIVKKAREQAIKSVNKEVSLPGFRKGKAPSDMILKKFGGEVAKQLHKAIADLSFIAAQNLTKVPLLNNNSPISFDMKQQTDDGAEIVFSFETEPTIPSVDPKLFAPQPIEKAEVGEKQLDEAIRQMQFFYAKWEPITDRPIQDGDYIMIDLDTIDDAGNTQKVFQGIRFEVSKARMANWMQNLVKGAKSGDVLEGLSEPDDTATEEEKKEFKPKKVKLSILKVEGAVLPEINDEFAKKVGASDVAHMRQSILDLLNKQADEKVQNEQREQVNAFLISNYHFELPQSLIDTEKKHRFNQMMAEPRFKANWNKLSQEERKNLEAKVTEESAQAVRLFYLSRQIVQSEKIPVTHQEVQNEAIHIYQSHMGKPADVDQLPKEVFALALSKIMLLKAQDFVLEACKKA
jgi:trigger factor